MNFKDIIKESFLEKFNHEGMSTTAIVLTLGVALALGMVVYLVYRLNTNSGFYNRSFNKSLAILPVITAAIMLAMGSNLTISLGMVGALSIVRFRNAIKDPIDLTYLFWSISLGIVAGASLFELAVILTVIIAILVTLLDMLPTFRAPCILVVSGDGPEQEEALLAEAKRHAGKVTVRSRNVTMRGTEWILEMKVRDERALMEGILALKQIRSAHLMTHDGDVRY